MNEQALAVAEDSGALERSGRYETALQELQSKVSFVNKVARSVLIEGKDGDGDYSVIPGTKKKTLHKSGAEKICLAFGFVPKYRIERHVHPEGHREYEIVCELYSRDEVFQGEGVGECSTLEPKYRYRNSERTCPECGSASIIKGKKEYGGGWLCWKNKGGCGAKYQDNDPAIADQAQGKAENPDPAELYNTVKKMAKKRAYVDACITASASGSLFTQDLEENGFAPKPPAPTQQKTAKPTANSKAPDQTYDQLVATKGLGNGMRQYLEQYIQETAAGSGDTEDAIKTKAVKHQERFWKGFEAWLNDMGGSAIDTTTADDIPLDYEDEDALAGTQPEKESSPRNGGTNA